MIDDDADDLLNDVEVMGVLPIAADMFAVLEGGGHRHALQRVLALALVRTTENPPFLAPVGPHGRPLIDCDLDLDVTVVFGQDLAPDGLTWDEHYADGVVLGPGTVGICMAANHPFEFDEH